MSTWMRFELTRAEPNGLAVHRLNHSATASLYVFNVLKIKILLSYLIVNLYVANFKISKTKNSVIFFPFTYNFIPCSENCQIISRMMCNI